MTNGQSSAVGKELLGFCKDKVITMPKRNINYRVFENEGHTENGHKTPKIWVLDDLFGFSVFYTSERFVRNTNLSSKYQYVTLIVE